MHFIFSVFNIEYMENKGYEKQTEGEERALMLTEEDINRLECYRHFTAEQKAELIAFVFELAIAIYHLYSKANEQH